MTKSRGAGESPPECTSQGRNLWSREDCDPIGTPSGLILKVLCVYIGVAISGGLLMFL